MPIRLDLNDKKTFYILVSIVLVVFSIILFLLLRPKANKEPEYLITTPYSFDTTHNVELPQEVIKDFKVPKSLNVYPIVKVDQSIKIDTFLSAIGKSALKKKALGTALYIWSNEEEYVEYIPNLQTVYFKFTKPGITQMIANDGVIGKGYLDSLASNYLTTDFKYVNEKITKSGYQIRIEANRSIDNYPLYYNNDYTYADYIVVDEGGKVYEGKLSLIVFDSKDKSSVDIVSLVYLQSILDSDIYPKIVYQGIYPQKNTTPGSSLKGAGDGIDILDHVNNTTLASVSKAKNIQLGYLYVDSGYTQLIPTYRIEAEGEATSSGKKILVPITVFANAMDPAKVYLPR